MNTKDFIVEYAGIGEDATAMHQDHEVQMARGDCYNAAKYAIELHKMLSRVSELEGIDGWVAEKLTLACDYLRTVHEYLDHEIKHNDQPKAMPEVFETAAAEAKFAELLEDHDDTYTDLGYENRKRTKGSHKPVDPKDLVVPLSDIPVKKPRGHKQYDPNADFPGVFKETTSAGIATAMGKMNPGAGTLFGGSYKQKDSPFKDAFGKQKKHKVIKRQ